MLIDSFAFFDVTYLLALLDDQFFYIYIIYIYIYITNITNKVSQLIIILSYKNVTKIMDKVKLFI